jgi:hypothetical protein
MHRGTILSAEALLGVQETIPCQSAPGAFRRDTNNLHALLRQSRFSNRIGIYTP